MGDPKKSKDQPKAGGSRFGSGLIWAAGQWAVCWFVTFEGLWDTGTAMAGAFISGWSTAALLRKLAQWGVGAKAMMALGSLVGVALFSGAFSGLTTFFDWYRTKEVNVDWPKLQAFLLSWSVLPPAVLGLFTGLYMKAASPAAGKK